MIKNGLAGAGNLTRRAVLRGATFGAAGLASAALLGCASTSKPSVQAPAGGGGTGTGATAGVSIPKNIKRAPGFTANLGLAPVNTKKVIPGGTYRRDTNDTSREQDPDVSIAGSDHELVNDRLFNANGWTMEISPDLLASYELVDKKGLQILLKLRPGIKTHNKAPVNGRVFTAADVAYSIMRKAGKVDPSAAKKYARAAQFSGLEKAEAVDNVTVKLTFGSPNSAILHALSDPRSQMIPREQDDIGYKDPMKFVGTGAWIQTEYLDGARQVFKANPDYYRSWDEGGRPGIDTYEKTVIADRASVIAAYISGQLGVIQNIQPQEEAQLKTSSKDSQWFLNPGPTWDHFAMNLNNPMFKDDRVRKALHLAIDFKEINDPLGKGWIYTGPLHALFPEALTSEEVSKLPGYNPATKQQDTADAVKMMDAAGFKDGQGLTFKTVHFSTYGQDTAVRLKAQWNKSWPKMNLTISQINDYASFTNILNNKDYEARSYNHTSVPAAAIDARTYYHTTGGRNYQGYSKPWADEALDKLLAAQTVQERRDAILPFQKRYIEEGPGLLQLRIPADNYALHGSWAGLDLLSGPWAYVVYQTSPRFVWQTEA